MKKKNIPSLDLHGHDSDKIFDILDQFIRQHKKEEQILIIFGKGKGILRNKVLEYLKITHYSWIDDVTNAGFSNKGALIVDLH